MTDEEFLAEAVAKGGFAHPCTRPMPSGGTYNDGGLTKRDWFAAMQLHRIGYGWPNDENMKLIAENCYAMADAMLAARK